MKAQLEKLMRGEDLSREEAAGVVDALAAGGVSPALAGGVLVALRAKGESAEELAGFADAMRRLARRPELGSAKRPLVDIVGTGGDGSSSYNISTGAALLAAACGLSVVKHGNRAISSKCGSADVLGTLGYPLPAQRELAGESLRKLGFVFLFAPDYHPAMAAIAPVRRELGVRTIFNMLGPLTNPAAPECGVIGAFSLEAARTIAGALSRLDIRRYFVVHGAEGWDEATPVGPFVLIDVRPGRCEESVRDPREFGFARCTPESLRGAGPDENASALREALAGREGPLLDCLTLGASLALEAAEAVRSAADGVESARAAVRDGRAARLLEEMRTFGSAQREPAGGGHG